MLRTRLSTRWPLRNFEVVTDSCQSVSFFTVPPRAVTPPPALRSGSAPLPRCPVSKTQVPGTPLPPPRGGATQLIASEARHSHSLPQRAPGVGSLSAFCPVECGECGGIKELLHSNVPSRSSSGGPNATRTRPPKRQAARTLERATARTHSEPHFSSPSHPILHNTGSGTQND